MLALDTLFVHESGIILVPSMEAILVRSLSRGHQHFPV